MVVKLAARSRCRVPVKTCCHRANGLPRISNVSRCSSTRRQRGGASNPQGDPVFEALRETRRTLAARAGLPPYVIFHDSTLREMAETKPSTLAELSRITGVGVRKLDAYGQAFLDAVAAT